MIPLSFDSVAQQAAAQQKSAPQQVLPPPAPQQQAPVRRTGFSIEDIMRR